MTRSAKTTVKLGGADDRSEGDVAELEPRRGRGATVVGAPRSRGHRKQPAPSRPMEAAASLRGGVAPTAGSVPGVGHRGPHQQGSTERRPGPRRRGSPPWPRPGARRRTARSATKSETVNPMPAISADAGEVAQAEAVGQARRCAARTASVDAAMIPTGLPTTSPRTMPQRDRAGRPPPPGCRRRSTTPALARAKSGTTRKLDQGCSRSSRSVSTSRPPTGPVGVSRPRTTPAIVAWTPDSKVQTHSSERRAAGTSPSGRPRPAA